MNRLMLIEIAKAHGLDIEEQVKYGGKNHLEKLDYIIAKQLETIRNQQKQLTAQNQQIQTLSAQIAEKDAELDAKLFRLSDVDLLIEQVTDICYEKAVTAVSESVSQTALDKAAAGVDRTIRAAKSPSSRLGVPFIDVVETWLGKAREDVFSALLFLFLPADFVQHLKQEDIQPGIVPHLHSYRKMLPVLRFASLLLSVLTLIK